MTQTSFKKSLLFLACLLLVVQCRDTGNEGVTIQGHDSNSNNEYIVLNYMPRLRGCLNFDNFRNTGTRINDDGYFSLSADRLTHAATYTLVYKNKGIRLELFKGDNLELEFDINDPASTCFAKGQGAAKINILNLAQFKPDLFYDVKYTLDEYKSRLDSITAVQAGILNAIKNGDPDNALITNAGNRDKIERIITENSISEGEVRFIENIIFSSRAAISGFITYLCERKKLDSTEIDFSGDMFSVFNTANYNKIDNTNDFRVANALEDILYLEYVRTQQEKGDVIRYNDWTAYQQDTAILKWIPGFIKANFNSDVHDKFFAENVAIAQTLGFDYQESYEDLRESITNMKYIERIDRFEELLENGLANPEYKLDMEEKTLDREAFEKLISNNDQPLFITFWSARFAGSTIIPHLPAIKDFERDIKDDFKVLNICIDEETHKNLWAARIIDDEWKAGHYFLPVEGNDSTLTRFNCTRLSSFCFGGAKYSLVDTNGNTINDLESPMTLTREKLLTYLED
ncbi:MAG: hypothetical protein ACQETA_11355 [Bacteroidota bacterium]